MWSMNFWCNSFSKLQLRNIWFFLTVFVITNTHDCMNLLPSASACCRLQKMTLCTQRSKFFEKQRIIWCRLGQVWESCSWDYFTDCSMFYWLLFNAISFSNSITAWLAFLCWLYNHAKLVFCIPCHALSPKNCRKTSWGGMKLAHIRAWGLIGNCFSTDDTQCFDSTGISKKLHAYYPLQWT